MRGALTPYSNPSPSVPILILVFWNPVRTSSKTRSSLTNRRKVFASSTDRSILMQFGGSRADTQDGGHIVVSTIGNT
jgi:hypothetical protein